MVEETSTSSRSTINNKKKNESKVPRSQTRTSANSSKTNKNSKCFAISIFQTLLLTRIFGNSSAVTINGKFYYCNLEDLSNSIDTNVNCKIEHYNYLEFERQQINWANAHDVNIFEYRKYSVDDFGTECSKKIK